MIGLTVNQANQLETCVVWEIIEVRFVVLSGAFYSPCLSLHSKHKWILLALYLIFTIHSILMYIFLQIIFKLKKIL